VLRETPRRSAASTSPHGPLRPNARAGVASLVASHI